MKHLMIRIVIAAFTFGVSLTVVAYRALLRERGLRVNFAVNQPALCQSLFLAEESN